MQPDPNNLIKSSKSTQCKVQNSINRYKNSLPQIQRSQGFFFFKQIIRSQFQINYINIGFKVGQVSFQLMDLFAVIINEIHCYVDANLKLALDGDQLWVISTIGMNQNQANISEALQKSRQVLKKLLEQCSNPGNRIQDKKILEKIRKQTCKKLTQIFKNPHLDD